MDKLENKEIEELSKYRFAFSKHRSDLSVEMEELLEAETLQRFLFMVQEKLNGPLHAAGSLFIKRYAFLAALVLYAMTVFDKALNANIYNISLEIDDNDPFWQPRFYFKSQEIKKAPEDRKTWRDLILTSLFQNNISKLIQIISKEAKISKATLWENIAVYIFWMYETLLAESKHENIHEKMKEDFVYCVLQADGRLFGEYPKNPLAKFYGPKTYCKQDNQYIRKRKTCCLFYLTNKESRRCSTCPKDGQF